MQQGHALALALGDVIRLHKPHPCGSREWRVVRLGADIGLVCLGCGHRVLLPRSSLARRIQSIQPAGEGEQDPAAPTS